MPLQSSPVSIDAMSNQTKIWAFILGPILAVIVYYLMPDQFVNASGQTVPFTHAGKACAAVTTLMAVWWFTEAIPIAVTAMIPIVLYPLLEVATPVNNAALCLRDYLPLFRWLSDCCGHSSLASGSTHRTGNHLDLRH